MQQSAFDWTTLLLSHAHVEHLIAPGDGSTTVVATAAFGSTDDESEPGDHDRSTAHYAEHALRFVEHCIAPARLLVCSTDIASLVKVHVQEFRAARSPSADRGLTVVALDGLELFRLRFGLELDDDGDVHSWLRAYCRKLSRSDAVAFPFRMLKAPVMDLTLHLHGHATHCLWVCRIDTKLA